MTTKWTMLAVVAIGLAVSAVALAATQQDVTLTVTIRSLGISVTPATYSFGIMNSGETKVSADALVVKNEGNDTEDVGIKVKDEDDKNEWTVAAAPDENVYALSTRLAEAAGTFVAGDLLTTAIQWCEGTKFGGGGDDMGAGATVNQWFQFKSPTAVTGPDAAATHTMTVEVSCRLAE